MKRQLIMLAGILLLSACSRKESIMPTGVCTVAPSPSHTKGTAFQEIIETYTQKGLPGIVLLVKDAEGTWYGASGKADMAKGIPMQPCHVNKVASLTKIFMGALTFKLAEEGKIVLDKKVAAYLSEEDLKGIANADKVTVRQLLKHTTGIFDVITDNNFYLSVLNDPPAFRDQYDILKFVRGKAAAFEAGTQEGYSNTNTLLLSMVIDKATGVSHAQLLRDKIIEPLGLHNSFYYYHDALPAHNVAQGYYDLFNNGTIANVSSYNTGSGNGYTGLCTNVFDLLQFSEALLEDKTLLSQPSLDQMLTFDMPLETGADRLLGAGTMKDFIQGTDPSVYAWGHRGRDLGYSADMFYFPEKGQTLVLIVNYGTDGESALRPAFYDLRKAIVNKMME
ncbi:MAG: class C beta-lactamase-related serine hydrolase [Sphingobacteriales bacterium]|nr:MAG: class C beta-lactamase-related serine hydrolase [Sphingobacteriales bacterium]